MINDPKWPEQMWIIPYESEARLIREGEKWFISFFSGAVRIPIESVHGEKFVDGLISYFVSQAGLKREERKEKRNRINQLLSE